MNTWSMPISFGKKNSIPCVCCGCVFFKPAINCGNYAYVRCKKCSLVQMNPQLNKEEILERYSSTYGNDYLSYELENEKNFFNLQLLALKDAGFYKIEKKVLDFANSYKKPSVLDVGCATGAILAHLHERGWNVKGVEISPSAAYAREKRCLEIYDIPLEEIKFPSESFDAVLASHLIEHLNDPRSFLEETRRILKKDGYVYITTPNINGLQAHLFKGRWRNAIFDHLYLFSVHTLKNLFKSCGFKPQSTTTWGGIAAGLSPLWIKKPMDFLAKRLGFGDVMIIRAGKIL